jgi:hypothetical protein
MNIYPNILGVSKAMSGFKGFNAAAIGGMIDPAILVTFVKLGLVMVIIHLSRLFMRCSISPSVPSCPMDSPPCVRTKDGHPFPGVHR